MDEKHYLTQVKLDELQNELQELKTVKRKEVAEHLQYARSLGDLSENAEYQEAREEQAKIEARIIHLESIIKNTIIINHNKKSDVVELGSKVTLSKKGLDDKIVYEVVGSEEADMTLNKLSYQSPLGEQLMGKGKGDVFTIKTPVGKAEYTIVDVE